MYNTTSKRIRGTNDTPMEQARAIREKMKKMDMKNVTVHGWHNAFRDIVPDLWVRHLIYSLFKYRS